MPDSQNTRIATALRSGGVYVILVPPIIVHFIRLIVNCFIASAVKLKRAMLTVRRFGVFRITLIRHAAQDWFSVILKVGTHAILCAMLLPISVDLDGAI